MIMKVNEIINRITDIEKCQEYLKDWADGKIQDQARIDAIVNDIETYLDFYIESMKNREVK